MSTCGITRVWRTIPTLGAQNHDSKINNHGSLSKEHEYAGKISYEEMIDEFTSFKTRKAIFFVGYLHRNNNL